MILRSPLYRGLTRDIDTVDKILPNTEVKTQVEVKMELWNVPRVHPCRYASMRCRRT